MHIIKRIQPLSCTNLEGVKSDVLEFDGQRDGVEEDVDLEDAEEEQTEVLEHLGKEIPEEADVRGQVWHWETGGRENTGSQSDYSCLMNNWEIDTSD